MTDPDESVTILGMEDDPMVKQAEEVESKFPDWEVSFCQNSHSHWYQAERTVKGVTISLCRADTKNLEQVLGSLKISS